MSTTNELLRGSVCSFRYMDDDEPKLVVIVSNDGRNRSRFEWVHVVCITTRPKGALPTIVELSDRDAPLSGRVMTDELELVHEHDLHDGHGMLSPPTMDSPPPVPVDRHFLPGLSRPQGRQGTSPV